MKNILRLSSVLLVAVILNACGGTDLTCDDVQTYQLAEEGTRVTAPEDLDGLDPLREVPLPEAAPREPLPEGSPCFDRPPSVSIKTES